MLHGIATREGRAPAVLSPSNLGVVGQVAASWGVAGGLLGAGVVAGHMIAGRFNSSIGFLVATIFFVAGSLIGFLHGGLLGYMGRPADVSRQGALRRLALAALYAVPAMLVGWLFALGLALSAAGLAARQPGMLLPALLAWLGVLAALLWAAAETRRALFHLYVRWPAARAALVVLALTFLALLPFFLVSRPEIWVVGVRPSQTAAVLMAAAATAWIAGPLTVLGVLLVRAWRLRHPH